MPDNGIAISVDGFEPVDFFKLFATDEMILLMTKEANRYVQSLLQQPKLKPNSCLHKWKPTTDDETKLLKD